MLKKFKGWFTRKNILWLFSMFIFTIICLEIFGRLYLVHILHKSTEQKFRFNSYRIYEHVPGFKEGADDKNWIEINNQGFRRTEETTRFKPENTYRIFLLGGSAAHGISTAPPYPLVHIYPEQTIDYYLEKMLEKKYKGINFEVINAAVTGYKTHQHTSYILSELLDYNPDMMIFFDGANDHYVNNPTYNLYLDNEYQFWKERLQDPSLGGRFDYFMMWLSEGSAFARGYMSWKMSKDALPNENRSPMYIDEEKSLKIIHHKIAAKNTFLRSVETNISILKNNNIACLITLQPMLVLRDEKLLSKEEKSWLHQDENVKTLYPIVVEELKELTSKHQVGFFDFNPAFNEKKDKSKQLFVDYCHLSPNGGKKVAESVFSEVEKMYLNSLKK
jgi:hypothetical protein